MSGDDLGKIPDWHTFIPHRIQHRVRRGLFDGEPEQHRRNEDMHRGPTAGPVPHIAGDPLFSGKANQARNEAVFTPVSVDRSGQAHHG
ncbi:hypothetical protein ART_1134 [Arthrobacter sp. PAMC 25486]|nr:hypothetical protein ART_1134 [Arthrobacter sp. PAMC 25486]